MFSFLKPISRRDRQLKRDLREILGIHPRNIKLYKTALVHRSVFRDFPSGVSDNNERLEYLGDSVINTATAEYLFSLYPEKREGFLSQMRSKIVSRKTLNHIAESSGINKHIVVRSGISTCDQKNLTGNTVEALIGAVFLDKGYERASYVFINQLLLRYVDLERLKEVEADYKSRLIEWGQKYKQSISISCVEQQAEVDNKKRFKATVLMGNELIGEGLGGSKKEAEQQAAQKAWEHIATKNIPNL